MFNLSRTRGLTATTRRDIDEEIGRVEKLLADLKALRAGTPPTELPGFDQAPILDNWSHSRMMLPCLVGSVTGHPRMGDKPVIHTSDLWVTADDYSCARTLSRWYRLGRPYEHPPVGGDLFIDDTDETKLS